MKLTAALRVNGRLECTLDLRPDRRRAKNEFNAREWIRSLTIREGDKMAVTIADEAHTLAAFDLEIDGSSEKTLYHGSQDTGHLFAWANVVEGYDNSKGFTAAVMLRKRAAPPVDVWGPWLDKGDGI